MDIEKEIKQHEIKVLDVEESARYFTDYANLEKDMNIQEVSNWLEQRENCNLHKPKDMLWVYDEEKDIGLGFVNSPKANLPVGIYFKHPRWAQGDICYANNHIDLEFFLYLATQFRRAEEVK
jgi:hypothetical protein